MNVRMNVSHAWILFFCYPLPAVPIPTNNFGYPYAPIKCSRPAPKFIATHPKYFDVPTKKFCHPKNNFCCPQNIFGDFQNLCHAQKIILLLPKIFAIHKKIWCLQIFLSPSKNVLPSLILPKLLPPQHKFIASIQTWWSLCTFTKKCQKIHQHRIKHSGLASF